jgi:hypothetical protein
MRPDFPYEFTEKQKAAIAPYGQSLVEISDLADWLRCNILWENRKEFRRTLDDLRRELTKLEALFLAKPEPAAGPGTNLVHMSSFARAEALRRIKKEPRHDLGGA